MLRLYQPDRFQQLLVFHLYHDWVSLENEGELISEKNLKQPLK